MAIVSESPLMDNKKSFEDRFPELAFLLRIRVMAGPSTWTIRSDGLNAQNTGLLLYEKDELEKDLARRITSLHLDDTEVLYLYGAGLGHYAYELSHWLATDPERELVVLEDDIEMLRLFANAPLTPYLMQNPRIHVRFLMQQTDPERFIDESAIAFPRERIAFLPLALYKKIKPALCRTLHLHLMRRTTVHHAEEINSSFYHVLSRNVIANIPRIEGAFYVNRFAGAFRNTPALICGAGPSLTGSLDMIRQKREGALLFAGGSAVTALSRAGILPHFAVAIDPNAEETERFRRALLKKTPLLYTNRLHPDVFDFVSGPLGYVRAKTGGPLEEWFEKEIGIESLPLASGFDQEALSVTTTCLEIATMMGCNPIVLVGIDLAFTDDMPYAEGVLRGPKPISWKVREKERRVSEQLLLYERKGRKSVRTSVKWIMESDAISRFVKANSGTEYINSTPEGLGFPDMPYTPLSLLPLSPRPLYSRVQELIKRHTLSCSGKGAILALRNILTSCQRIVKQALREIDTLPSPRQTARLLLCDRELRKHPGFALCLEEPTRGMQRRFHRLSEKQNKPFNLVKWIEYQELIEYYLNTLQNNNNDIL